MIGIDLLIRWQNIPKNMPNEKAIRALLIRDPKVQNAMKNYVNSLNLQGQINAKIMTPNQAMQQFYGAHKAFLDYLTRSITQAVRQNSQGMNPDSTDYANPNSVSSAMLNPNSMISQIADATVATLEAMTHEEQYVQQIQSEQEEVNVNTVQSMQSGQDEISANTVQPEQEASMALTSQPTQSEDSTNDQTVQTGRSYFYHDAEKTSDIMTSICVAIDVGDKEAFTALAKDATGIDGQVEKFFSGEVEKFGPGNQPRKVEHILSHIPTPKPPTDFS